jgi:CarD family transcriptional regulator
MFVIGSKVVHPAYGAGTIRSIQQKRIGDHTQRYYVIDVPTRSLQVMVPVTRAAAMGLREVASAGQLRRALGSVLRNTRRRDIESDYRVRQSAFTEQIKSGSFRTVARVVGRLCLLRARRPLGVNDARFYDQGKRLLAGELALATGQDSDAMLKELDHDLGELVQADELLQGLREACQQARQEIVAGDLSAIVLNTPMLLTAEEDDLVTAVAGLAACADAQPSRPDVDRLLGHAKAALAAHLARHSGCSSQDALKEIEAALAAPGPA